MTRKKIFSALPWKMALLCLVLASVLFSSGCNGCNNTCDLRNTRSSARVVITSITAPPGGPKHRFLEVTASGFHPNAAATLKIPLMPTLNGTENLEVPVTMDAQGALRWTKEPVVQLGLNADPNTDIFVNVVETASGCFAATAIKQQEFKKIQ